MTRRKNCMTHIETQIRHNSSNDRETVVRENRSEQPVRTVTKCYRYTSVKIIPLIGNTTAIRLRQAIYQSPTRNGTMPVRQRAALRMNSASITEWAYGAPISNANCATEENERIEGKKKCERTYKRICEHTCIFLLIGHRLSAGIPNTGCNYVYRRRGRYFLFDFIIHLDYSIWFLRFCFFIVIFIV